MMGFKWWVLGLCCRFFSFFSAFESTPTLSWNENPSILLKICFRSVCQLPSFFFYPLLWQRSATGPASLRARSVHTLYFSSGFRFQRKCRNTLESYSSVFLILQNFCAPNTLGILDPAEFSWTGQSVFLTWISKAAHFANIFEAIQLENISL